jgi:predicted metal-dependent peptidase
MKKVMDRSFKLSNESAMFLTVYMISESTLNVEIGCSNQTESIVLWRDTVYEKIPQNVMKRLVIRIIRMLSRALNDATNAV